MAPSEISSIFSNIFTSLSLFSAFLISCISGMPSVTNFETVCDKRKGFTNSESVVKLPVKSQTKISLSFEPVEPSNKNASTMLPTLLSNAGLTGSYQERVFGDGHTIDVPIVAPKCRNTVTLSVPYLDKFIQAGRNQV
jgi:hypothetical protein